MRFHDAPSANARNFNPLSHLPVLIRKGFCPAHTNFLSIPIHTALSTAPADPDLNCQLFHPSYLSQLFFPHTRPIATKAQVVPTEPSRTLYLLKPRLPYLPRFQDGAAATPGASGACPSTSISPHAADALTNADASDATPPTTPATTATETFVLSSPTHPSARRHPSARLRGAPRQTIAHVAYLPPACPGALRHCALRSEPSDDRYGSRRFTQLQQQSCRSRSCTELQQYHLHEWQFIALARAHPYADTRSCSGTIAPRHQSLISHVAGSPWPDGCIHPSHSSAIHNGDHGTNRRLTPCDARGYGPSIQTRGQGRKRREGCEGS